MQGVEHEKWEMHWLGPDVDLDLAWCVHFGIPVVFEQYDSRLLHRGPFVWMAWIFRTQPVALWLD